MGKDDDLTLAILREIREGVRGNTEEIQALSKRVDDRFEKSERSVNHRFDLVDQRFDLVDQRFEVLEGSMRDLAAQQLMLTRYVKNVVDRYDKRLDDLEGGN